MKKYVKLTIGSISLIVFLLISFLLNLLPLIFIVGLVLLQKVVLDSLVFPSYAGIDISFFSLILCAIIYGPTAGFIFGLAVIPLLGIFRIIFVPPTAENFSLIPSFGSLIVGLLGLLAGLMASSFPFFIIVIVTIILKNVALTLQKWAADNMEKIVNPIFIFNIFSTIFIAFLLEERGFISFIIGA